LASARCGNGTTPTSPTTPDAAVEATTRLFTGTLSAGGAQYYSFTVPQESGVFITLASLTSSEGRGSSNERIGLALGVPRGTRCAASARVVTGAALAAQIREWSTKGVHCVAVDDPGTLTSDVMFAVRIGYFQ
jgi:hypothetical protein